MQDNIIISPKAFCEVYDILRYMDKKDFDNIPKSFVEFIKNNRDDKYVSKINPYLDLKNQELLDDTKKIISMIYIKYLSTEIEKNEYQIRLKEEKEKDRKLEYEKNEIKIKMDESKKVVEREEKSKYYTDNYLEIKKENIFRKILNKIFSFFNKNK